MSILLGFLSIVLVIICLFLCLLVLIQKPRADSGMGAAIGGGGFAEQTFGAESGNVLTKLTIWSAAIFFVLGFALYLGFLHTAHVKTREDATLPTFPAAPAAPVPRTGINPDPDPAAAPAAPPAAQATEPAAPRP